jgi:hypothetical protein
MDKPETVQVEIAGKMETVDIRLCPEHAPDPVDAILAKRQNYTAKCPQCGRLWD